MCTYRTRAKEIKHLGATQAAHIPRGVRSGQHEWNIIFEGSRTEAVRQRFSGLHLERKCATLWIRVGGCPSQMIFATEGEDNLQSKFYGEQKCLWIHLNYLFYKLSPKTKLHIFGQVKLHQFFTFTVIVEPRRWDLDRIGLHCPRESNDWVTTNRPLTEF